MRPIELLESEYTTIQIRQLELLKNQRQAIIKGQRNIVVYLESQIIYEAGRQLMYETAIKKLKGVL